jgi:uncharacterized protein (DUF1800 family)
MDERSKIAWLHRRFGFGVAPGELDAAVARGLDAELDRLLDPDAHGVAKASDPWAGITFSNEPNSGNRRGQTIAAIDGWLEGMRTTPRPLHERVTWMWHDHFATSIAGAKAPGFVVDQIRTIQSLGMGSFADLLKALTLDPAMLFWLNGDVNTGANPNENYGRELLELFTVGIGNHTEDDVQAAARALTGWRVERGTGRVIFVKRRHDDTAQTLLGMTGVHDVDTVIDAVTGSPALPTFVATMVTDRLLGPVASADAKLVAGFASTFAKADLQIAPLITAIVEAGLDRLGKDPIYEAPVPWLIRAERATGARTPTGARVGGLRAAGQLPMVPPDVGGWPSGDVWLTAAPVVGRASLAAAVAAAAPASGAARKAAASRDYASLATAIGRPDGLAASTTSAMKTLTKDTQVLALALCAPEQVVV